MRERIRRNVGLGMAVILLVSSLGVPPASAGTVREGKSLAEAEMAVLSGPVEYNGSEQKPKVSIHLDGVPLREGVDYRLSYADNLDAGTAVVMATGTGAYHGSREAKFTILPRTISAQALQIEAGCQKKYDETTEAFPTVSVQVLPGDQVEVRCTAVYDTCFVGRGKTVTVSGLHFGGPDGDNYRLEPSDLVLKTTGQITPQLPDFQKSAALAKGHSLDLRTLFSDAWKGEARFQLTGEALGCTLQGTTLTAGQTLGTVKLQVTMTGWDENGDGIDEYSGGSGIDYLTVTVVDKESQPPGNGGGVGQPGFSLQGPTAVTYGQSISFQTTGGAGTGKVTFWVEPRGERGAATIDSNGVLQGTQTGSVLVYAKKDGDDRYESIQADPIEVTIRPAKLTIQVHNKTAAVGDPVPALTQADYTVSGLVGRDTLARAPTLSYGAAPNLSLPGVVPIQAAGAVAPAGDNYDPNITYVPGTLTIREVPVYPITVAAMVNGAVTTDCQAAEPGTTVTLTVRPAEGFRLEKLTAASGGRALSLRKTAEGVYTFSMPEGAVTVTAQFIQETPEQGPFPFTDVPETAWYYDSVVYVYTHGLMNGTGPTTFQPNAPTTRGMVVTILYRMEGSPEAASWSPFGDVDPNAYYAAPVAWAAWNGIVNGYSATTFGPQDRVTREQLAAILYRYAAYKGCEVSQRGDLTQFVDAGQIHTYAREALSWANRMELIQGKGKGILDPRGLAARAQVAAMLQRFQEKILA